METKKVKTMGGWLACDGYLSSIRIYQVPKVDMISLSFSCKSIFSRFSRDLQEYDDAGWTTTTTEARFCRDVRNWHTWSVGLLSSSERTKALVPSCLSLSTACDKFGVVCNNFESTLESVSPYVTDLLPYWVRAITIESVRRFTSVTVLRNRRWKRRDRDSQQHRWDFYVHSSSRALVVWDKCVLSIGSRELAAENVRCVIFVTIAYSLHGRVSVHLDQFSSTAEHVRNPSEADDSSFLPS